RWALLGALTDVHFVRPDGNLASFEDVHNHLEYYRKQLPPDWNPAYQFDEVRYTNWEKIPVLLPALHKVLSWLMPSQVETISLRAWVTNNFYAYAVGVSAIYVLLLVGRFGFRRRRRRREANASLKSGDPKDRESPDESLLARGRALLA